jgi:hypothetical protein
MNLGRTAQFRFNTAIGYGAGYNNTTGIGNVFLGYYTGYNETGSNKLYIDNSATSSPLIYGEFDNDILAVNSTVGIGTVNPGALLDVTSTSRGAATIGGGWANQTNGNVSTVEGGASNYATADASAICGGSTNDASGEYSFIGGGVSNDAGGDYSTVPGGRTNYANGDYSFAAGRRAKVRSADDVGGGDTDGDEGTFI